MLYVDLPTKEELLHLSEVRCDACVSLFLPVSPLPQDMEAGRIALGNMIKEALVTLADKGLDKRRMAALEEELAHVVEADDFWLFHANSLAVLATPEMIRTYRLANTLQAHISVADRFYIKPLFRALTFPHSAFVLALSENEARVVELLPEGPPEVVKVPNMPKNALEAIGRASTNTSTGSLTAESGSRGPKMRLAQYARKVNEALRPLLAGTDTPLILMSTEPLGPIFRSLCHSDNLVNEMIYASPDRITPAELANMARPLLDKYNAQRLEKVKELFEERTGQNRVAADIASVAKAATYGMVSLLLADFDRVEEGFIDESGAIRFSSEPGAHGLIDEIVKRSFACGAQVIAVRKEKMIGSDGVAAILRYPM